MTRLELESEAVAYAMLITAHQHDADWHSINARIKRDYGVKALVRIKKRAWQHVKVAETRVAPTEGGT